MNSFYIMRSYVNTFHRYGFKNKIEMPTYGFPNNESGTLSINPIQYNDIAMDVFPK